MYLQNIMSSYLNEANNFEIEKDFKPIKIEKSEWNYEEKRIVKSYKFKDIRFLEQFVLEIVKYNRESNASIEVRFRDYNVGVIVHSRSFNVTEIEIEATKDIDKIKNDVMYYYARWWNN